MMVTKAIWVIIFLSHYHPNCLDCVTEHEVGVVNAFGGGSAYEEE